MESIPIRAERGPAGQLRAGLEVEDDCESALEIDVAGMTPGDYDVLVDGDDVADLTVAGDGTGGARFDPTADDAGELVLDFPFTTASSVELVAQP